MQWPPGRRRRQRHHRGTPWNTSSPSSLGPLIRRYLDPRCLLRPRFRVLAPQQRCWARRLQHAPGNGRGSADGPTRLPVGGHGLHEILSNLPLFPYMSSRSCRSARTPPPCDPASDSREPAMTAILAPPYWRGLVDVPWSRGVRSPPSGCSTACTAGTPTCSPARSSSASSAACRSCCWSAGAPRIGTRRLDGALIVLRPDRARCRRCAVTQVLLPVWCVPRRGYGVEVVGAALLAAAEGAGHRRVAACVDAPAGPAGPPR